MTTSTAIPMYRKDIIFNHETRDYAMYLDGELVGFARTHHEAEVTLDQLILELLDHGIHNLVKAWAVGDRVSTLLGTGVITDLGTRHAVRMDSDGGFYWFSPSELATLPNGDEPPPQGDPAGDGHGPEGGQPLVQHTVHTGNGQFQAREHVPKTTPAPDFLDFLFHHTELVALAEGYRLARQTGQHVSANATRDDLINLFEAALENYAGQRRDEVAA